jgi:hypothetical protein
VLRVGEHANVHSFAGDIWLRRQLSVDILGSIICLVALLVLAGIIAIVVALVRHRTGEEEDSGIGTLRRLYYYGLAFVALMVAVSGAILLVSNIVESLGGSQILSTSNPSLALGLAMTLVGTPVWLLHWNFAQRALREFPAEARALSRKAYLTLILGIAAVLFAVGTVSLLRWVLGAGTFESTHVAIPLVWGAVWLLHYRIEALEERASELGGSIRWLYVYATALYGLGMLTAGMGVILWRLLQEAYDQLFSVPLLVPARSALWDDIIRTAVAAALVGGTFWWWHWHRVARDDSSSTLRQVYLYLFGILGGSVMVVAFLSFLLFGVLQWLIGVPEASEAAYHFRFLPIVAVGLVIGVSLWGYHWAIVGQESPATTGGLSASRRVYRYLVAALGLGTLATGLVILISTLLGLLVSAAEPDLAGVDWWRTPFTLAITLLAVGVPLWGLFWSGVQREAMVSKPQERDALSRRVFIYLTFGAAMLVALGNLSALLFIVLRDLLGGQLSLEVLQAAKWSIGMLLTAGATSAYYWLVLREDRQALAGLERMPTPAPRPSKVVIALSSEAARPLIKRLELVLGYPIVRWRRLGPEVGALTLTEEDVNATKERISSAPGDRVLITFEASGIQVLPFQLG